MLENVDTEGARMTVIDNFGGYQVPRVQPGTYPIRAELAGFKSVAREKLAAAGKHSADVASGIRTGRSDHRGQSIRHTLACT